MTVLPFPSRVERVRASAPESAKLLKAALRAAFPACRFSVTLSRGTGYGYCDVRWTDGPTTARVRAIADRYRGSIFDGMQDAEIQTGALLPDGRLSGLRGVTCTREISARFAARLAAAIATYWRGDDMQAPAITETPAGHWSIDERANRASVARTGLEWYTLIHRASEDRTRVTVG